MLSNLKVDRCGISNLTPIIDHLCQPSASMRSLSLPSNQIEFDQVERLVSSLAEMQSLTSLDLRFNTWCLEDDTVDNKAERIERLMQTVSQCWNLTEFCIPLCKIFTNAAKRHSLTLQLAINRAWKSELCCKKKDKALPQARNLLPLIVARALRTTVGAKSEKNSLDLEVLFPLLKERVDDLVHH
ncbi:unnamed protein product [Cylindrotheca closterium]|uniref:Uncharacterized protein n=1 Tax=Cylindrotheca closterium TaxID=2856 RepID=A0AAD2G674_9STRA|nr:unnamed protein product [Cylindrotheca closterium]